MFQQPSKQILLGTLAALLLITMPAYAVKKCKISSYGGAHQIWFEVEDYDKRDPDTDQYFRVVDRAGAFGKAITRAGGAGGMIRWIFDISQAGGKGGTWYFWGRVINPSNQSDFMVVEGHPGDPTLPAGPPYPGTSSAPGFTNSHRVFEEDTPSWGWVRSGHQEAHTKQLKDGQNTMSIVHRQGDATVFWDVFMWTDSANYVPTDADYENAKEPLAGAALSPSPANDATDVPRDATLSWKPGKFAATHDVYFGTTFADVNDASRTNPRGVLVSQNQVPNSYSPTAVLQWEQIYYWRIDEVNAPPDFTIYKGEVWQFTAEPFAYPVAGTSITATASSQFNANTGPQNTINGSGLDANDLHSIEETSVWLSGMGAPQPTWIQYAFDRVYKLHQMWVWNHNTAIEATLGFGIKDATIEYSVDGANWTTLGTTHQFARAPGTPGYAANTTIDLTGVVAKYVKLTANSNWGGILPQYGLSEVRFFYVPVLAREPNPASGATDVPVGAIGVPADVTLSFRAGREAAKHNVYFSDSSQAVIDSTAPATTVSQTRYGPLSLDLGKAYYWRVDEVNEAETPATWQGELWDFTTQQYFIVDDFEDYNDFEPDRIFDTWIDGWNVPANGSQVGYAAPPFAEKTIIHGGKQSMPFDYNNTAGVAYSEAERTFASPQDWTFKGVKALSLWFRGNPVGFLESPPGTFTMSADGVDIWGTADQFRFAYKQLTGDGSIISRVESVELVPGSNDWVKAGVMIRETLDPGSKFAAVYMTPTRPDGTPTRGCRYQARLSTGGSATSDSSVATTAQQALIVPYWIKMERVGNKFNAYYSADGVSWQAMVWNPQTIPMVANVYIGLALTSHSAGVMASAKFSNVSTTGNVTGVWQVAAIGVAQPSNTAAPLYVTLTDSANKTATVKHSNPAATNIATWTEWNIDLSGLTGVNPRSIKKMIIGVGDRLNPQPAAGKMYFDDIRLYPQREPPVQLWFEAESGDTMGASWRIYNDPNSSGGKYIGSNNGDGDDNDYPPGANWVASYNFTTTARGVFKILFRVKTDSDSFWVRIPGARHLTPGEDPDNPGTGWVRFNGIAAGAAWHWDEVHSDDHNRRIANWTLLPGAHTVEIAKREDGTWLDALVITSNLDLDQATLRNVFP